MKKYLKNTKTGVVFNYSDVLAKRKVDPLAPCDIEGNRIFEGDAEEKAARAPKKAEPKEEPKAEPKEEPKEEPKAAKGFTPHKKK